MSHTEQDIEREVAAKGLTAPRVTPEHVDSLIRAEARNKIWPLAGYALRERLSGERAGAAVWRWLT